MVGVRTGEYSVPFQYHFFSMRTFLSKFDRGPLKDEQIASGMHLSYKNARRLYYEAWILTLVGSLDRAIALCVLSLEELGRIPLLLNAVIIEANDDQSWEAFWRKLRSHPSKQAVWSHYGRLLEKAKSADSKFFTDKYPHGMEPLLDKFKQCGFYVPYFDGHFLDPRQFARDNWRWLRYLLFSVRNRIKALRKMHSKLSRSKAVTAAARVMLKVAEGTEEGRELIRELREAIIDPSR